MDRPGERVPSPDGEGGTALRVKMPVGLAGVQCPACGIPVVVFGRVRQVCEVRDLDGSFHDCYREAIQKGWLGYADMLRQSGTMYDILLIGGESEELVEILNQDVIDRCW